MTIEDGIAKEKFLEERAASDVEFRKELIRRNGPDPYIEYWLEESEKERKYHEQVAEWLEELKRLRLKTDLMDEESTIMGYRIRDLIITAERIQKEGVDPWKLRNSTENFMAGYERARNDMDEAMVRQMQEIMSTQNNEEKNEEKQEGTE